VSPILVRPVREQLEHDRVIRLLQVKLKRRHDVTANIGEDQSTSVKIGQLQIFPDLVLTSADRARKLMCTVEVETSESVNHLEARAQWAHLGKARAPFHLYVPAGSVDIARRLAAENQVNVSEIWTYHTIGDQTVFRMAHRAPSAESKSSAEPRSERRPAARAEQGSRPSAPAARAAGAKDKTKPTAARGAKPRAATAVKKRPVAPARRPAAGSSRGAAPRKSSSASQRRK
jgi:hypothetical protein